MATGVCPHTRTDQLWWWWRLALLSLHPRCRTPAGQGSEVRGQGSACLGGRGCYLLSQCDAVLHAGQQEVWTSSLSFTGGVKLLEDTQGVSRGFQQLQVEPGGARWRRCSPRPAGRWRRCRDPPLQREQSGVNEGQRGEQVEVELPVMVSSSWA